VEVVINYEAPSNHDIYLHRVGRTARAGKNGLAITLTGRNDRSVVKRALRFSKKLGGRCVSRDLDPKDVDKWHKKMESLHNTIEEKLQLEQVEKELALAEKEALKGQNMMNHEKEILSRPRRTWFMRNNEKENGPGRDQNDQHNGHERQRKPGDQNKKTRTLFNPRLKAAGLNPAKDQVDRMKKKQESKKERLNIRQFKKSKKRAGSQ
jgi:ATP-dependent RNA helicase DDX27